MRSFNPNRSNSSNSEQYVQPSTPLVKYIPEKDKWYRLDVSGQYLEVNSGTITDEERFSVSNPQQESFDEVQYTADQADDMNSNDLQSRLEELMMTEKAATSVLDEVALEKAKIQQQIIDEEEERLAAVAAEEARKAREALARYANGGAIRPAYGQQADSTGVQAIESGSRRKISKGKAVLGATAVSLLAVGVGSYTTTDSWKDLPFAAAFGNASPDVIEKTLSEEDLVAGECAADNNGKTPAVSSNEISVQADVLWPITLANGDIVKIEVADEENPDVARNPYVQITADSYLYACVSEADKKDFLQVNDNVITADLSKATPQIKIGPNKALDPIEPIILTEVKDETGAVIVSKEVADAAVAGPKDPANISFLIQVATAHAGAVLANPDGSVAKEVAEMFSRTKPEIITDLKAQAAALGYEDVTVEVKGEYTKDVAYVGEAPKTSDKVSIDEKSLIVKPVAQ